jgi:glycosyltransferase involved in cell wall biosynthesis
VARTPFRKHSNPILFVSDRAEDLSGLARCARDIASLAATLPEFRVGYLGRGGIGKKAFPWTSYSYPENAGWGQGHIEEVIRDFFGEERGIIFSNWDLSRLGWMFGPQYASERQRVLFGEGRNFELWGYPPVDSTGPDGHRLGVEQLQIANGPDRILAPSEWGMNVLKNGGRMDADYMPHGLFLDRFKVHPDPRPLLGWKAEDIFVGICMTNQARKDWPVAFECLAVLKQEFGNRLKAWLHVDRLIHYFNLYALATDYGVADCLQITTELNDDQLALRYSACDCTLVASGGEGFCYPCAESMACGTACVVANYAAAQELVPEDCRVHPVTYRVDTQFNCRRAVLSGYSFANAVKEQIEKKRVDPEGRSEELAEMVAHLSWDKLKVPWTKWLLAGLRQ